MSAGVYEGRSPWFQQFLGLPEINELADGTGIRVALLSSGVDVGNAQLSGLIEPGVDVLSPPTGPGATDCDGRGTLAAGLIAAQVGEATSFRGLAPGVTLLPVRVVERVTSPNGQQIDRGADAATLAAGLRWATANGASVVGITVTTIEDTPDLRAAVTEARAANVLVVAGGVVTDNQNVGPRYPSAYEDVLAVAGVQPDGTPVAGTEQGDYIDLAGPAGSVLSTGIAARPGELGHTGSVDAPEAATALVTAAAALLRQARPELSAEEVAEQLEATALPAPVLATSGGLGAGIVDPYAALSRTPLERRLPIGTSLATPMEPEEGMSDLARIALAVTGAAAVSLFIALVTVQQVRNRGRRRGDPAGGPERSAAA